MVNLNTGLKKEDGIPFGIPPSIYSLTVVRELDSEFVKSCCFQHKCRKVINKRIPIKVETLDDVFGEDACFDFIKMDIHGVEWDVLNSMSDG